jgi:hypothetical protein
MAATRPFTVTGEGGDSSYRTTPGVPPLSERPAFTREERDAPGLNGVRNHPVPAKQQTGERS